MSQNHDMNDIQREITYKLSKLSCVHRVFLLHSLVNLGFDEDKSNINILSLFALVLRQRGSGKEQSF